MEDRSKEYNEIFTNDETEHESNSLDFEKAFEESLRLKKIKEEIKDISDGKVNWGPAEREATLRVLIKESKAIEEWMRGIRNTCSEGDEALPILLQSKSFRRKEAEDSTAFDNKGCGMDNYFILSGDSWKVRFEGGEEKIVNALAPIKTVVEYLRNPGKILQPSEVYRALHASQSSQTSANYDTRPTASVCDLNRDTTKTLTATAIKDYSEDLSEMIERKNLFYEQSKTEDAEALEEKIEKVLATLESEYSAKFDGKTGKLISANRTPRGRDLAAENTHTHIKRAIQQLKYIKGLPEHLEKYLLKNKNIYQPPKHFPKWLITD